MENKKALSNIVGTVLIVLLALAAIAIVWSFIAPVLRGTGTTLDLQNLCLLSEAKPLSCTGGIATIQLVKGDLINIESVIAVLEKANSNVVPTDLGLPSEVLASVQGNISAAAGDKLRAAVIVKDGEGNTATCEPSITSIACG